MVLSQGDLAHVLVIEYACTGIGPAAGIKTAIVSDSYHTGSPGTHDNHRMCLYRYQTRSRVPKPA